MFPSLKKVFSFKQGTEQYITEQYIVILLKTFLEVQDDCHIRQDNIKKKINDRVHLKFLTMQKIMHTHKKTGTLKTTEELMRS